MGYFCRGGASSASHLLCQGSVQDSQISCFPPANFTPRQALYVDSFCWVAAGWQSTENGYPLLLHKYFPYILLLLAVVVYIPTLFWRFTAAPQLSSDLGFIMEELEHCYNHVILLASSDPDAQKTAKDFCSNLQEAEGCVKYPLAEQFLLKKRETYALAWKYLLFLLLTLSTLILACSFLLYYIFNLSQIDHFSCELHTGVVLNRSAYPPVPCKLVSVGVFQVFSCVNVCVYMILLVFLVIHTACLCAWPRQQRQLLQPYERLPAFSCAQGLSDNFSRFEDLSIYLLFLEENLSELKSFKYVQVLDSLIVGETAGYSVLLGHLSPLGQLRTTTSGVEKK
ncbi:pannexin-1-like [Ictalurus furcatus]|uniref:pannexin-1-like n=1 Tax=Ictalurus furcatus TaxID=66913 RepID=UPI0023504011|nr:pannexin-1-like [Ictalurus furcatus]